MIATTVYMNVVPPPPAGTTDPVLHGVPGNIEAITAGDAATVWWTDPTATDATDPSPTVTCDPAGGTSFPVGTAAVTCTATDAAGNDASETSHVTVVHETPAPPLTGTWSRPFDDGFPALTARAGCTIRLKLGDVPGRRRADARHHRRTGAPDPTARRLHAGRGDGRGTRRTDDAWANGDWQLKQGTASLGSGCVRITATVDGRPVAHRGLQLVPETATPVKANNKR